MWRPGCMEVLCSSHQCALDPAVEQRLRAASVSGELGWRPGQSNQSQLWGHTLLEASTGLLGTSQSGWAASERLVMSPVQVSYDPDTLPRVFRAQDKWPGLIGGVRDQVSLTCHHHHSCVHWLPPQGLVWRVLGSVRCVGVGGQSQHWPRSQSVSRPRAPGAVWPRPRSQQRSGVCAGPRGDWLAQPSEARNVVTRLWQGHV